MLTSPVEAMRQMFLFKEQLNIAPSYNVAPTQEMPIGRRAEESDGRELVKAKWGLIPHWAKDTKLAYSTINARSETTANKPAFRDALKRRHALIPADAFYVAPRRQG
jgi:putative SOS response-associated peptidase YedK